MPKNNFDLLRLGAAISVALMHLHFMQLVPYTWLAWPNLVFPGVLVFFIISGFLITNSWLTNPNLKRYAWHRFRRIYPGLIASVAFTTLVMGYLGYLGRIGQVVPWFLGCASLLDVYHTPAPMREFGLQGLPNGPWWTLPVELAFYIILPVVLRFKSWAVALLMGVSALLVLTNDFNHPHLPLNFDMRHTIFHSFWWFGLGIIARLEWDRLSPFIKGNILPWAACYVLSGVFTGFDSLLSALPLAGLILALAFTKPVKLPGDFSYGIYLYHAPLIHACRIMGLPWIVAVAGTAVMAAVSWFGVEKPWQKVSR